MGFTAIVGDKTCAELHCLDCGILLRRYTSDTDINLEIFTDLAKGEYPIELCRLCWDFWRDHTKKATDNPRSMSRVGI